MKKSTSENTAENLMSDGLRRQPKYMELAREIGEQVRSGQLQPGDRLPSLCELREKLSVGNDTLERMYKVLERDGLISRQARRGVFVTEPRAVKKTGVVGFINSSKLASHPYYSHLLQGVQRGAEAAGVEVLLLSRHAKVHWEKVDGVLYQASQHDQLETPPGMARVSLIHAQKHLDSVVADDYLGFSQAMEHLWELGHRRIAFLTLENKPSALSHQRAAAYRDAFLGNAMNPENVWTRTLHEPDKTGRTWEQTGYDDMTQWLREDWSTLGCTAIMAHNDETAIGVIAALQDAGLRVPEDVSVVGFDGTEIAQFHRPRLTTVKVPLKEIGARGFEMLVEKINRPLSELQQERLPLRLSLPTQLHTGETVARISNDFRMQKDER